jgi:hypothetical protein
MRSLIQIRSNRHRRRRIHRHHNRILVLQHFHHIRTLSFTPFRILISLYTLPYVNTPALVCAFAHFSGFKKKLQATPSSPVIIQWLKYRD